MQWIRKIIFTCMENFLCIMNTKDQKLIYVMNV